LACFAIPAEPSAVRVATWRTLKQLGAAAMGGGVYALPERPALKEAFLRLKERVNNGGGSAFLFEARGLHADDEAAVIGRFTAARSADYAQVIKSARRFVEHVERETSTQDFRFVEVESLEEELEKVRRQLHRVRERDHFGNATREEAQAAVIEAERALAAYVGIAAERGEP
jgi:hypothetical protein